MKKLLITGVVLGVLSGCINSYTSEGDHKEIYWNVSPTIDDSLAEPTKSQA